MKYPSIFIALLCTWVAIILIAFVYHDTALTLKLYRLVVIFSLVLFLIGFWRNK